MSDSSIYNNPYLMLLAGQAGSSGSSMVNLMQDLGFSFAPNAPFQSQLDPWVGSAAPVYYNTVEAQYGGDTLAQYLFDEIDAGVAPDVAYEKLREAFPDEVAAAEAADPNADGVTNPEAAPAMSYRDIGGMYANEKAQFQGKTMQWQADQQFGEGQYNSALARERAQYEANAPVTINDFTRSQRDVYENTYGDSLSGERLLQEYVKSLNPQMKDWKAPMALPEQKGAFGNAESEWSKLASGFAQKKIDERLNALGRLAAPSDKAKNLLQILPALSLLGK